MILIPSLLVCEGKVVDPVDGHCLFADVFEAVRTLRDFGAEFFHLDAEPNERKALVEGFAERGLPLEVEARGSSPEQALELLASGADCAVFGAGDALESIPEEMRFRSVVVLDEVSMDRASALVDQGFTRLRIEGAPDMVEQDLESLVTIGAEASLGTEVRDKSGFAQLESLAEKGLASAILHGATRRAQAHCTNS